MQPTLSTLLEERLAHAPQAPAFVAGDRRVTVSEFDAVVRRVAGWLARESIGPGDRVAVWLVNRIEWLALLFALARLGASLVAVNTRFRAAELEHVLRRSRPRMLVVQRGFRAIDFGAVLAAADPAAAHTVERIAVLDAGADCPERVLGRPALAFDALQGVAHDAPEAGSPEAVAAMFTTSGTTRGPKLVMHSQRAIALHAVRCARAYGFAEPGACLLAALPLCGVFGLSSALAAFAGGAPVVLMETFDGEAAARLARAHAATHLFGSDEMLRRMLEAAPPRGNPFPALRMFGFAAFGPGARALALEACARGVPVTGLYGSSEVHALFAAQPSALPAEERIAAGGRPASSDAEVRVRDLETGAILGPGASGELEIRAPTNFLGYFDDPGASAEAIGADGFFRTGDIGRLAADGRFLFETRRGDAIRLGGFLVDPSEIEEVLRSDPTVAAVQVVAVEIDGQTRPVAFAIPAPGGAPQEARLIETARARMAAYKVPVRVWFVESFPTTASANGTKIQRSALREMARARLAAERGARS
ncbi:MAG: AMP-binding protein [Burkholderiales bacterium]|nr:AMP-binding protein [Burkholderiales bacterium]